MTSRAYGMARAPYKLYQIKEANADLIAQDARLESQEAELTKLRPLQAENESLKQANTAAEASITEATSQLSAENAKLKTELAEANKAKTDAEIAFKAKEATMETTIEQRASAKARDIVAGQGVAPVAGKTDSTPGAPPKADTSGLTGRARVAAAFHAETSAIQPKAR